jgi:NADH:ubiquinone oxidoreductase subunit C
MDGLHAKFKAALQRSPPPHIASVLLDENIGWNLVWNTTVNNVEFRRKLKTPVEDVVYFNDTTIDTIVEAIYSLEQKLKRAKEFVDWLINDLAMPSLQDNCASLDKKRKKLLNKILDNEQIMTWICNSDCNVSHEEFFVFYQLMKMETDDYYNRHHNTTITTTTTAAAAATVVDIFTSNWEYDLYNTLERMAVVALASI